MIIFPMAGNSSRFFKAGYSKPKYMLNVDTKPVFDYVVESFKNFFSTEIFLFIIRDIYDTENFIKQRISLLKIKNYKIIKLNEKTKGQADTVYNGLHEVDDEESIIIFNIDTIRPNYVFPEFIKSCDGYLEVFRGKGDNWSFVKTANENSVIETAEKNPISNLCSTGLYYFKYKKDFLLTYNHYLSLPKEKWVNGEIYIAPLYNYLIKIGKDIRHNVIRDDEVIFCGTPKEYQTLVKNHQIYCK